MSGHVTIVGVGPGDPGLRSVRTAALLDGATRIVVRTLVHPGLEDLAADARVTSCDDLYETSDSFEATYRSIVERVIERSSEGDVVYVVPGSPMQGEQTVQLLRERLASEGTSFEIVPSVGAIDAIAAELGVDLIATQTQIVDSLALLSFERSEPFSGGIPELSPGRSALITQIYSRAVASTVKAMLSRVYPEDHQVVLITGAGSSASLTVECSLFEIDRQDVTHLTSLWVPPLPRLDATRMPATLHAIAAHLRGPDGCPWDRAQSHQTLISAVVEEAYEVVDAIEDGDPDHLAEELGDLLLQVALHAQIAEESGEFTAGDVYDHVNRKLIRRHPHVFGDVIARDPDAVVRTWDAVKQAERTRTDGPTSESVDPFDRLPRSMPVSLRLHDLHRRDAVAVTRDELEHRANAALAAIELLARTGVDPEIALTKAYRDRRRQLPDACTKRDEAQT